MSHCIRLRMRLEMSGDEVRLAREGTFDYVTGRLRDYLVGCDRRHPLFESCDKVAIDVVVTNGEDIAENDGYCRNRSEYGKCFGPCTGHEVFDENG